MDEIFNKRFINLNTYDSVQFLFYWFIFLQKQFFLLEQQQIWLQLLAKVGLLVLQSKYDINYWNHAKCHWNWTLQDVCLGDELLLLFDGKELFTTAEEMSDALTGRPSMSNNASQALYIPYIVNCLPHSSATSTLPSFVYQQHSFMTEIKQILLYCTKNITFDE
jgi:hypothetical protein